MFIGVLEEPTNLYDNDATRKAKTFYNSCMDLSKYIVDNYSTKNVSVIVRNDNRYYTQNMNTETCISFLLFNNIHRAYQKTW